jgi:hypothetical protein
LDGKRLGSSDGKRLGSSDGIRLGWPNKPNTDIEPFAASQQTPVTSEPINLSVVATLETIYASSEDSNCSLDIEPFAATPLTLHQKELIYTSSEDSNCSLDINPFLSDQPSVLPSDEPCVLPSDEPCCLTIGRAIRASIGRAKCLAI